MANRADRFTNIKWHEQIDAKISIEIRNSSKICIVPRNVAY